MAASDRQVGGKNYKEMGIQPWDVVDTWPYEQRVGFYRGNALKYVMRAGTKDEELVELGKARHYIDKLIEVIESHRGGVKKSQEKPVKTKRYKILVKRE